jgi:hypothetical protein
MIQVHDNDLVMITREYNDLITIALFFGLFLINCMPFSHWFTPFCKGKKYAFICTLELLNNFSHKL